MLQRLMIIPAIMGIFAVVNVASADDATAKADSQVSNLSPKALDALVGGVAFFPDAVIEQALAAAANPNQLRKAAEIPADEFQAQSNNFDASLQYLKTKQPELLKQLNDHLTLTARLGLAAQMQPNDVWKAIDEVRAEVSSNADEADLAASNSDEAAPVEDSAYADVASSYMTPAVTDELNRWRYNYDNNNYVGPAGASFGWNNGGWWWGTERRLFNHHYGRPGGNRNDWHYDHHFHHAGHHWWHHVSHHTDSHHGEHHSGHHEHHSHEHHHSGGHHGGGHGRR